jgi:hypothetical protein
VRLQVVARTERVVDKVIVVFQAEALRFGLDHRRRHRVEVSRLNKQRKARIVIAHERGLVLHPAIRPHAQA